MNRLIHSVLRSFCFCYAFCLLFIYFQFLNGKHADKHGNSKLLEACTLPLTGVNCITRIITDLAVMEVHDGAFHLKERAPGVSIEEIQSKTAGKLIVAGDVPEMAL